MMKYISIVFLLFSSSLILGQGINFFHGTWEEALAQAAKEEKLIFVDAYAKWCGPCKRMAKDVFTQQAVGDYYNANFINMKIDMEEGMGLTFRKDYPVRAYPTLMFIDDKGEIVRKAVGGKQEAAFVALGEDVVASYDRSGEYAEEYEKGNRNYDLVIGYVKALNKSGKPSSKIANDFLRNNKDLSGDRLVDFLYESVTSADSRIFELYASQLDAVKAKYGAEAAMAKINRAGEASLETAIAFESMDLLEQTHKIINHYNPAYGEEFKLKSYLEYARATNDISLMRASIKEMTESVVTDNQEKVDLVEELMLYQVLDTEIADTSEEIMSKVVKKSDQPEYRLLYAQILHQNNKDKKALKEAEKAYKLVDEEDACRLELQDLIESIKAK
jgi:thiol-disulfide isomerase/thioredoxin